MITIPISDRLIRALCDTLIHSLWQGVLLAAIGGLIVICTRKASSVLRYNLLVSALIFFAVGASVTFTLQYLKARDIVTAKSVVQLNYVVRIATAGHVTTPATAKEPGFTDQVSGWLNE